MRFISTRGGGSTVGFKEALLHGLAPDGGLYHPTTTPNLSQFFSSLDRNISFPDLATRLTTALLGSEISSEIVATLVAEAFPFSPALVEPAAGLPVLELFHGPSAAFKDFGASFQATAMHYLLADRNEHAIILTATSGDTGSAVAQAFYGKERITVVILYPSQRVSPLQEKQLSTFGGNVIALEVAGTFDDCQRMVKAAFTEESLKNLPLSSANSINLGRLIPQTFYYIWAWCHLKKRDDLAFIVPSGNFGNMTAGLYAASWGLPAHHFVAATNANDVLPEYLRSGMYSPRPSISTYSNAMDVGSPSNYERLEALFSHDIGLFRKNISAEVITDAETLATMRRIESQYNYFCCPHTAVGWLAAERYHAKNPQTTPVILSTAHPGKFLDVVKKATGKTLPLPPQLRSFQDKKSLSIPLGNRNEDLSRWLLERS